MDGLVANRSSFGFDKLALLIDARCAGRGRWVYGSWHEEAQGVDVPSDLLPASSSASLQLECSRQLTLFSRYSPGAV